MATDLWFNNRHRPNTAEVVRIHHPDDGAVTHLQALQVPLTLEHQMVPLCLRHPEAL